jgi:Ca2+-binding EF-hand superfamily protein
MKFSMIIAAAAALSLASFSADAAGGGGKRFDRADINRDGRITLQEFGSFTTQQMANGKGKNAEKFRQLSPDQQANRIQRRFERLDEGRKGYLTRADFEAARNNRQQQKPSRL